MKSCSRSTTPLACGSAGARNASRPSAGRRTRRTPRSAGRRDRGCRPDGPRPTSAAAPQRPQTPRDPRQQVRRLFGEDQRAGTGAGVAQARDDDSRPPGLTMPDRDLSLGLPEIELADLARAIDRPLKRPRRRREQRPHLTQIIIDDRLATLEPSWAISSRTRCPWSPRILAQQPVDLVLERIELRPRRRPRIARRAVTPEGVADRFPVQAGASMDLPDRQAAHEMQPPHLRPLLHSDHLRPPELALRKRPRLRGPPDDQAVQFSTSAGGPVFTRASQRRSPRTRGGGLDSPIVYFRIAERSERCRSPPGRSRSPMSARLPRLLPEAAGNGAWQGESPNALWHPGATSKVVEERRRRGEGRDPDPAAAAVEVRPVPRVQGDARHHAAVSADLHDARAGHPRSELVAVVEGDRLPGRERPRAWAGTQRRHGHFAGAGVVLQARIAGLTARERRTGSAVCRDVLGFPAPTGKGRSAFSELFSVGEAGEVLDGG